MNIAFVLLTYNPNEPAGIERSVAGLAEGLRRIGHRALIIAAGPATSADGGDLVRLAGLTLPRPAVEDDLHALMVDHAPVEREIHQVLADREIDLVCWVDAVWGLGYLSPAPKGVRTALMVHVLRTDAPMLTALNRLPDTVLTVSRFMIEDAARQGLDASSWKVLPNAVPVRREPPDAAEREGLRRSGPIRIVARAEPHKGIAELLRGLPGGFPCDVEIVLAAAGFEYWPGMQEQVLSECRALAAKLAQVELLPALPWEAVPDFLAGAAACLIASTSPETFGLVAAEALSVATPVVGYGLGHLPELTGPAGSMVELSEGPERLWQAAAALLTDRDAYHRASNAGPHQVSGYAPRAVAQSFLDHCLGWTG